MKATSKGEKQHEGGERTADQKSKKGVEKKSEWD